MRFGALVDFVPFAKLTPLADSTLAELAGGGVAMRSASVGGSGPSPTARVQLLRVGAYCCSCTRGPPLLEGFGFAPPSVVLLGAFAEEDIAVLITVFLANAHAPRSPSWRQRSHRRSAETRRALLHDINYARPLSTPGVLPDRRSVAARSARWIKSCDLLPVPGGGPCAVLYVPNTGWRESRPPRRDRFAAVQAARRRTSQTVTAPSSTDSASSQPPSIHWKGQKRLTGW